MGIRLSNSQKQPVSACWFIRIQRIGWYYIPSWWLSRLFTLDSFNYWLPNVLKGTLFKLRSLFIKMNFSPIRHSLTVPYKPSQPRLYQLHAHRIFACPWPIPKEFPRMMGRHEDKRPVCPRHWKKKQQKNKMYGVQRCTDARKEVNGANCRKKSKEIIYF